LQAKDRTMMHDRDALLVVAAGGGGYGDPLERPAERVLLDHLAGATSPETMRSLYGVVLGTDGTTLDRSGTGQHRQALRAARLREGTPADPDAACHASRQAANPRAVGQVDDCLSVVESGRELGYACARCGHGYGPLHEDPKRHALLREVPITAWSEWNRYGLVGDVKIVEFYCPGCALLIGVQVRKKEDRPLWDLSLHVPVRE